MSAEDSQQVRALVDRAVAAAVPPAEMVERKIQPGATFGYLAPRPAAGLRAALTVASLATDRAYGFVKEMRAEGTTWAEVVGLLEIPWSPDYVQVERAYELVAAGAGGTYSGELRLYWTCGGMTGCGESITDYGPYGGFPADCERGHAGDCRRHAAERAAYAAAMDEREARAEIMDAAMAQLPEHSFGRETVKRARYVLDHGGRWLGWSTGEGLAAALVLEDADRLKAYNYSDPEAALDRVLSGMSAKNRPPDPAAWLRLLRAAATGVGQRAGLDSAPNSSGGES